MITTKLFLYDSNAQDYKGTEYSQYILSGNSYKEDLTEEMDTCEITLEGVPFKEEFEPTTKFIMELYTTYVENNIIVGETLYETYAVCVANDVVSKPILSDGEYYTHSISFTEASVIAQQKIVDNFSETYKLKDVSIDVAPTYEIGVDAVPTQNNNIPTPTRAGYSEDMPWHGEGGSFIYRFIRKYEFDFRGANSSAWDNVDQNTVVPIGGMTLTLPIPLIWTTVVNENSTSWGDYKNYCSVVTKVYKRAFGKENWETEQTIYTNPSTSNAEESTWTNDWLLSQTSLPQTAIGYGTNRVVGVVKSYGIVNNFEKECYYKRFATFDSTVQNRTLTISLVGGYEYKIEVTLNKNQTTQNYGNVGIMYMPFNADTAQYTTKNQAEGIFVVYQPYPASLRNTITYITEDAPKLTLQFNAYAESASDDIVFASAPPISAYDLFVDAQLKSQQTWRDSTNYIRSDAYLPFYCNQEDTELLKSTSIIESSYYQKNLWEVLLEIGKYIHAIPYIEFGEDNRFLVSWHKLGVPTQYQDKGTTMSIFNSRSLENYISATNSYVTNMIQLGGEINEWVAPKSESEDFLVYNDVAVIKTTKPMIEILQLGVKNIRPLKDAGGNTIISSGVYKDLTDCVFEKSIYDLLDITGSVVPNKGLALYYNLGENVIRGLNYQMPAVNAGDDDSDYAIKRILGNKYSLTTAESEILRVYDFVFFIKYRTKESVRSEQSRPDLRKYLINGVYDNFPIHKQFNNQQDVSVDSVKFGNQVYGKLIKTGNTEIKTTEWCDNLDDIKHAGQLIEIYGNLYYVAQVQHTFYQDHIDSEITYSKDYNQLSEIVGIPSEPRFYEISERNIIDRFVNANGLLKLTTNSSAATSKFINTSNNVGMTYLKDLMFVNGTKFPQFALTQFKNDPKTTNTSLPNINNFSTTTLHPLSGYSMKNTLSLKWEMETNFSAGDKSVDYSPLSFINQYANSAYAQLIPIQYCDGCGRADLYDFAIVKDLTHQQAGSPPTEVSDLSNDNIQNQPESPYRFRGSKTLITYYGLGKTYSTLGLIDINIDPTTELSFGISLNGKIKDKNGNILVSYSDCDIGDYIIVINNAETYAGVYRCASFNALLSTYTWQRYETYKLGSIDDLKPLMQSSITSIDNKILFGSDYNNDNFGSNTHGLALAKDNRERLLFNFNMQMLTDSDRFVLSGYLWRQEKSATIKVALLTEEVNKISNDTIDFANVIRTTSDVNVARDYTLTTNVTGNTIHIPMSTILAELENDSELASQVKAIAIYSTAIILDNSNQRYFIMARNVSDLSTSEKIADWYITGVQKSFFKQQ